MPVVRLSGAAQRKGDAQVAVSSAPFGLGKWQRPCSLVGEDLLRPEAEPSARPQPLPVLLVRGSASCSPRSIKPLPTGTKIFNLVGLEGNAS